MSRTRKQNEQKTDKQETVVLLVPSLSSEKKRALELKLDKARWYILRCSSFYGMLLMSLRDVFSYAIPTACADAKVIAWNPIFLDRLEDEFVRFILIHEVCHCAYGHLWRFPPLIDKQGHKNRDEKGNIACDHAINLNLIDALSVNGEKLDIKMPEGGLADVKYKGLAEEEIYALLPDMPQQNGG